MAGNISMEDSLKATREAIVEVIANRDEVIELALISEETRLYDTDGSGTGSLGLDSLDALDLIGILEERFNIEVSGDVDFEHVQTVRDVAVSIIAASEGS